MILLNRQSLARTCSLLTMDKIDARKLSPDALKALRSQAMRLRQELGLPWREIARVMGLSTTTVFGWAQRYAAEGDAGLVSRKRGRTYLSGRTLTLPQEWVLRTILTSQAPSTRSLPFALWNRRTVRDLIKAEFAIDMPIRTVGEYLRRWCYTPQRPTRQALEQKPWDVQRWMQEVYPLLAQKAKQEDGINQPALWLNDGLSNQQPGLGAVRVPRRRSEYRYDHRLHATARARQRRAQGVLGARQPQGAPCQGRSRLGAGASARDRGVLPAALRTEEQPE